MFFLFKLRFQPFGGQCWAFKAYRRGRRLERGPGRRGRRCAAPAASRPERPGWRAGRWRGAPREPRTLARTSWRSRSASGSRAPGRGCRACRPPAKRGTDRWTVPARCGRTRRRKTSSASVKGPTRSATPQSRRSAPQAAHKSPQRRFQSAFISCENESWFSEEIFEIQFQ